jgi:putative mRNA 3-end processing factor
VDEVGSLGVVLETAGRKILLDYGFSPHDPPRYPLEPPDLDGLLLSHSHLDHAGMVAWIAGHLHCPIFATPTTQFVTELLAFDSLKIADIEGWKEPFSDADIERLQDTWTDVSLGDPFKVAGLRVTPTSAGHIPGSTMYLVEGDERTLFTGDLNTSPTRLMRPARPVECDTLIMESTYAGREHRSRAEIEAEFLDAIDEVVDRGGVAVVPAFAVGRTQEVLLALQRGGYEVWVDGMGRSVLDIYLRHPEAVKDAGALRAAVHASKIVHSQRGRELALRGDVIVTTSGMVEGGPVYHYLSRMERDRKSALFLTGYQVPGTGGRRILDEGVYDDDGTEHKVECEVRQFDFSAHLGHTQLIDFARACNPQNIALIHGDRRELLAEPLEDEFNVVLAHKGDTVELGRGA